MRATIPGWLKQGNKDQIDQIIPIWGPDLWQQGLIFDRNFPRSWSYGRWRLLRRSLILSHLHSLVTSIICFVNFRIVGSFFQLLAETNSSGLVFNSNQTDWLIGSFPICWQLRGGSPEFFGKNFSLLDSPQSWKAPRVSTMNRHEAWSRSADSYWVLWLCFLPGICKVMFHWTGLFSESLTLKKNTKIQDQLFDSERSTNFAACKKTRGTLRKHALLTLETWYLRHSLLV